MRKRADGDLLDLARHSPAAPHSRPGLRRRLSALRAGLNAALRALRAQRTKN